jgi:hypothetical protein
VNQHLRDVIHAETKTTLRSLKSPFYNLNRAADVTRVVGTRVAQTRSHKEITDVATGATASC